MHIQGLVKKNGGIIKSMCEKVVNPDRIRDLERIQKAGQDKTMKSLQSFISHKDLYL